MFHFTHNDVTHELKRLFIINNSINSYETPSSQIFHIPKERTSKLEINTINYDRAKIWNQFYSEFVFNELSLTKSKFKALLENHFL